MQAALHRTELVRSQRVVHHRHVHAVLLGRSSGIVAIRRLHTALRGIGEGGRGDGGGLLGSLRLRRVAPFLRRMLGIVPQITHDFHGRLGTDLLGLALLSRFPLRCGCVGQVRRNGRVDRSALWQQLQHRHEEASRVVVLWQHAVATV